jgi:hypothetical protein
VSPATPNRYKVYCRNAAELDHHLTELREHAAGVDLDIYRPRTEIIGYSMYDARLEGDILEWVKQQDEVICIAQSPAVGYGDPDPRKWRLGRNRIVWFFILLGNRWREAWGRRDVG